MDLRVPGLAGTPVMKVITQSEARRKKLDGEIKKNAPSKKKPRAPKRKGGLARKEQD